MFHGFVEIGIHLDQITYFKIAFRGCKKSTPLPSQRTLYKDSHSYQEKLQTSWRDTLEWRSILASRFIFVPVTGSVLVSRCKVMPRF